MTDAADHLPSIAIVGGGSAGWMAAAVLANAYGGRPGKITFVETGPAAPVSRASVPTIRKFNDRLGIAEADFLRATQATFTLGTEFRDWAGDGTSFFHPFGQYGTSIGNVGFHHCWLKARQLGDKTELAQYSLAAVAASLGRFAHPSVDASSVLSSFSYGYHFNPLAYIDELRHYALARGVTVRKAASVDAALRAEDGFIAHLLLDKTETLPADLYIDCSGASGILIERALRTGYDDWSAWLPCDRVVSCQSGDTRESPPLTEVTAHETGWQWRAALQDRTSHGYVYSSRSTRDWTARNVLLDSIESAPLSEPVLMQFTNGRRKMFWNRNCVALGAAAGFLEPLESTDFHLVQGGISRLLQLLPGKSISPALADDYNRLTAIEFEHVRDFLILHYHANRRTGQPFWDACRTMAIPDSLAYKIELFRSRGRIAPHGGEIFFLPSWLSLFAGLDIEPRRYHPFADGLDGDSLKRQMHLIRATVRQAAETLPDHRQFLAQMARAT